MTKLNNNTSTTGDYGTSISGYHGTSISADSGTSISGYSGASTVGYYGTSIAGYKGVASAGIDGSIIIKYYDGGRYRTKVGYIGEDGLKPDTPYEVVDGEFVEVSQ